MDHKITEMKFIAVFSLLLFTIHCTFAQDSKMPIEFLARGKALGFVIIEDVWVRSFSVGTEVKLYEQFSLAVDVVHFRWRKEEEVYFGTDFDKSGNYTEYSQYDPRNYLALEGRYYPSFLQKMKFKPYLTILGKWGKQKTYLEDKYPIKEGTILRSHTRFLDLGPSLGFSYGERFGIDVNVGAVYRQATRSEDIFHLNQPVSFIHDVQQNEWIPNIRVNFFYNFSR